MSERKPQEGAVVGVALFLCMGAVIYGGAGFLIAMKFFCKC